MIEVVGEGERAKKLKEDFYVSIKGMVLGSIAGFFPDCFQVWEHLKVLHLCKTFLGEEKIKNS